MNVRVLIQYINLSLLVTFNGSLGAVGSVMLLMLVLHSISFVIKIHHQTSAIITYFSYTITNISQRLNFIQQSGWHEENSIFSSWQPATDPCHPLPPLFLQRLEFFDQRSALILSHRNLEPQRNRWNRRDPFEFALLKKGRLICKWIFYGTSILYVENSNKS